MSYIYLTLDVDVDDAKVMFDVNFWGVVIITQASSSSILIAAKARIVNMGSINSVLNPPWVGIYSASQATLGAMIETRRLEVALFGVKILTVITGAVEANIMNNGPAVKLPLDSRYKRRRKRHWREQEEKMYLGR